MKALFEKRRQPRRSGRTAFSSARYADAEAGGSRIWTTALSERRVAREKTALCVHQVVV
jgi:hypothetical protein